MNKEEWRARELEMIYSESPKFKEEVLKLFPNAIFTSDLNAGIYICDLSIFICFKPYERLYDVNITYRNGVDAVSEAGRDKDVRVAINTAKENIYKKLSKIKELLDFGTEIESRFIRDICKNFAEYDKEFIYGHANVVINGDVAEISKFAEDSLYYTAKYRNKEYVGDIEAIKGDLV